MKIIDKIKNAEKVCLVLQGGGMRGSYTTGVMQVLDELNLIEHIRYIVAESAGALNAAYFKTGQSQFHDGAGLYADCLATKEFITAKKFPNVLDINYLKKIVEDERPLDLYKLRHGYPQLHVSVTNAKNLEPEIITSDSPYIYEALIASMSVPIFWGHHVIVDEKEYIDGGVSHVIPYEYALTLDADLYIIVLTNGPGYRYSDSLFKKKLLGSRYMKKRYDPRLLKQLGEMDEGINATLSKIKTDSHYFTEVEAIFPSDQDRLTSMLEIDRDKLMDCQRMGHDDAKFFLQMEAENKTHSLLPRQHNVAEVS